MVGPSTDYREVIEFWFGELPLQHAEDLAVQERSVRVSERYDAECEAAFGSLEGGQAAYAREHRDIVARFGRFPHRNKALGRQSTPEEVAYLASAPATYGQDAAED